MLAGSVENLDIKIEIAESGSILTSRYHPNDWER